MKTWCFYNVSKHYVAVSHSFCYGSYNVSPHCLRCSQPLVRLRSDGRGGHGRLGPQLDECSTPATMRSRLQRQSQVKHLSFIFSRIIHWNQWENHISANMKKRLFWNCQKIECSRAQKKTNCSWTTENASVLELPKKRLFSKYQTTVVVLELPENWMFSNNQKNRLYSNYQRSESKHKTKASCSK